MKNNFWVICGLIKSRKCQVRNIKVDISRHYVHERYFTFNYEITGVAGTASNREVKLLLTISFLNDALGLEL